MMFSLNFILVVILASGVVTGQTNDINTLQVNNREKGFPFGKLRLFEDGQKEELISSDESGKFQLNQDQSAAGQPLPSPCIGSRPSTKLVYPKDKTKYIQCRDEYHYEVFTCPNGGEYNEQTNVCNFVKPIINKCEEEKPCLNDGQCSFLSNSTFKCTCRQDWTGDRCDIPLTSCVTKPCGPNAECRTLKTADYEQDYVCICHERKGYGLTCQEVVPNPCLTSSEQYFPYGFSQRAYIQCDGELVHFQPCGPSLYWHQEDKICDRKRPTKIETLNSFKKFLSTNDNDDQQGIAGENIKEEITVTTTVQTDQQNSFIQRGTQENENVYAFVPARIANRQQLQSNMNNQQGQLTQDLSNQLSQSADSNQIRQDFNSILQQWPTVQMESNIRQPLPVQVARNQPRLQNVQQQWVPTLPETSFIDNNKDESQTELDNQQQQQQQNLQQQNQAFGTQQWLNQVPGVKTQSNQRFVAQPQSWQGSHTMQNQPRVQDQYQQTFFEPITSTTPQNIISSQGFQNQNTRDQEQSWQPRSSNTQFTTLNTQNVPSQTHTWQSPQSFRNQQPLTSNILEETSVDNKNRLDTGMQQNNQQPWQNKGNNQFRQNVIPSETSLIDVQRIPFNNEQSFTSQSAQDQHGTQTLNPELSADLNNDQLQKGIQSPIKQQNQAFGTQQWLNQIPVTKTQSNQRFVAQPQSWQGLQTIQNQPQFQNQNQQMFVETTTATQNVMPLQGFQNQNTQEQELSWLNKRPIQQIQKQPIKTQSNQVFAFKPTQRSESAKQNQQDNMVTSQSLSQQYNQQPLLSDSSSQIQNTQFGSNQQQTNLPTQTSFEQYQPWSNNQQLQKTLVKDFDDLKIQTGRPVQTQHWSQIGQLGGNSFETTTTTTIPNKGVLQGFAVQNLHARQPIRMMEQRQQDNNQMGQQTTTDQRISSDSMPTAYSGSWPSRS